MTDEELAKKFGGTIVAPQLSPGRQQRTPALYTSEELAKQFGGTPVAAPTEGAPAVSEAPAAPISLVTRRSAAAKAMTEGQDLLPFPASSGIIEYAKPDGSDSALMSYEKPKAAEISVAELSSNPDNYKTILDFSKARYNRVPAKGETKEEFTAKFLTDMRNDDFNTLDLVSTLNYMRNAKPEDAAKTALAKALYEKTASPFDVRGGGQKGFSPYYDVLKALATDPLNYFGGITGVFGRQMIKGAARREAAVLAGEAAQPWLLKAASATPNKVITTAAFGEGVIGAGQSALQQKMKQDTQKALGQEQEDLSYSQLAVAAIFSTGLGYVGAKGTMKQYGKSGADELNALMQKAKTQAAVTNPNAPITPLERQLADPIAAQMNLEAAEFMKREGKKILDEVSPMNPLMDAKIADDMSARAIRVARHIIDNDPAFRLGPNEQISTAIANVFSKLDSGEINDAVLEQAINKAGLTPLQFAQANKITVSQAASIMQQYSVAGRAVNKLKEIDPEFKKMIDALFDKPDEYSSMMGIATDAIQRAESESKSWMTSGIGTTVRNVLGTIPVLTYTSAASVLEGTLYTLGRATSAASTGKRVETFSRGMADTMRDSLTVYYYLGKADLSDEVTYALLEHNPSIRNNILNATQVGGDKELFQVTQLLNSLNQAQDAYFRKAIFNASVEKSARRAGIDPFLIMAEGKSVPASILQKAADDALKATFSYHPKVQSKAINTVEAKAETVANHLISAIDKLPGGSLLATFPRFMSNAMAFQYRYSIFNSLSGSEDIYRGGIMEAEGKAAGAGIKRQGMEKFSQGLVGTAALGWAYAHRLDNQDSNWWDVKRKDGSTIDMRGIFPFGPMLATADVLAKLYLGEKPDTAGATEAVVGMKMPAGTQNQLLEQVFAAVSSEKEADKLDVAIGKVLGDFTTRFTAPFVFKSASEFLDIFRQEGGVQRDPNVITADTSAGRIAEAAANRVQSKLPIVKESLPEVVPRLREGPVVKEGEFFNSLVGVRVTPKKTLAEQEIINVNIEPFKVYGGGTGNKVYDREYISQINPRVISNIESLISRPAYQELPMEEKRLKIQAAISHAVEEARGKTLSVFMKTEEGKTMLYKMEFDQLPADERKAINNRYAKENKGVTLEEANDYKQVKKYIGKLGNVKN
jgi:hypothetical protein